MKTLRKFNCTIAELYAICRICWTSCLDNIAAFTAFKTFYNAAFATTALAEVDAAEEMPDEQERGIVPEALRLELQQAGQDCITLWLSLKAYIISAFAEESVEMNLEAAGEEYYDAAYRENWENMQLLMSKGKTYITNNIATLTAGGMPAGFQALFDAGFTAFTPLYNSFKSAQQTTEEQSEARLLANNALYDKVMAMNADGRTIFRKNQPKYDRFVFAKVKALVTPPDGEENILGTLQNTIGMGSILNLGPIPAGTQKIRMTTVTNGALEFGLSVDGMIFNGNTVALSAPSGTTYTLADFASTGNIMMVRNQSPTLNGVYKIEFLG